MNQTLRSFQDKQPKLGERIYIDPSACVIGDVHLNDDVSIWPMAVVRGDVNTITIGKACNIQDGAIIHVTHEGPYTPGGQSLVLGEGITIGHRAVLHACHISDYCLIGIGATILDKVHIEDHVMIGAGSLVPPGKILRRGHLYLGHPVRKIRPLTKDELANLEYSAHHYVRLKNQYLLKEQ